MFVPKDDSERFSDLLSELRSQIKFSDDWWLNAQRENRSPSIHTAIERLDNLFSILGDDSWRILKEKLTGKFLNENKDRGKDGFFNTVNEAYAYKYLSDKGFDKIEFVEESNDESTPDIRYSENGIRANCEVKTINTSDAEIHRTNQESVFDIATQYSKLNRQFFHKLGAGVVSAEEQMQGKGIVFVIVHFDDFTNQYLQNYRRQITEWLSTNHEKSRVCISTVQDGQCVPMVEHNVSVARTE